MSEMIKSKDTLNKRPNYCHGDVFVKKGTADFYLIVACCDAGSPYRDQFALISLKTGWTFMGNFSECSNPNNIYEEELEEHLTSRSGTCYFDLFDFVGLIDNWNLISFWKDVGTVPHINEKRVLLTTQDKKHIIIVDENIFDGFNREESFLAVTVENMTDEEELLFQESWPDQDKPKDVSNLVKLMDNAKQLRGSYKTDKFLCYCASCNQMYVNNIRLLNIADEIRCPKCNLFMENYEDETDYVMHGDMEEDLE